MSYNDIMDNAMVELIRSHRFYAELLHRIKREYNTNSEEIPTIGISVHGTGFKLTINPYFFGSLTLAQQVDILKHEAGHVLHNHLGRETAIEAEVISKQDVAKAVEAWEKKSTIEKIKHNMIATRLNIAEDIALNEYLPNIPRTFNIFDKEGKPIIDEKTGKPHEAKPAIFDNIVEQYPELKNLERNQIFEYYYKHLKEQAKKNGEDNIKIVTIDCHGIGKDGKPMQNPEGLDGEFIKELAKGVVNQAAEATKESMAGNIPGDVEALINKLNYKPKDWRSDLRKFVSKACESIIDVTKKKRNRRYGMLYAGHIHYPNLHLVVAADSSGSVAEEEFNQFMAEIDAIHKAGARITFVECDAAIQYVGEFNPKKKLTRRGHGGTLTKPVFELLETSEFKKKYGEFDGLIYLSDMEIFDVKEVKKPKYGVLWAGIGQNAKNVFPFGWFTKVEIKKKG